MEDIKIIRPSSVESQLLPGTPEKNAGWIKRIIYPHNTGTKGILMGLAEANPGFAIHRWHTHTKDKAEGYEIVYPESLEEIHYIVSGSGVMQWKTQNGKIREEKVYAGDSIFFPRGVAEHQLLNNGDEKLLVIYCASPIAKVTATQ